MQNFVGNFLCQGLMKSEVVIDKLKPYVSSKALGIVGLTNMRKKMSLLANAMVKDSPS